jgi:hypothetical protein
MTRLSAAVLLLFVSAAAQAQESGAPVPQPTTAATGPIVVEAAAEAPAKEEKVVCRRVQETGSIRAKRVCRTESQMAAEAAQGERTLDRARTQRNSQNLSQMQSGS